MSEYIGNRIVPRHDGVWDKAKEYEPLTIVYEESTGDSYMSRKPVPAGTLLSQEEYWAMCSRFSEQMALYRQNTAEEVEQFRKDTAADVEQLRTDTASDVAALRKMTAQDVADITQKVDAANSAVAASKSEMDKTTETLKAQINANVKASTDKNANYAQELVDARVDDEGKKTQEQNTDGSYVTITADFRKYACVEDSIADHAAYLLGAMNGNRKRYEGLAGCIDYKKAAQIIKDGGYATSHTYVQSLCSIIERWNLTQYNATSGSHTTISGWYRVRKSWQNAASQKGAFHDLTYAKQCADKNPGYYVFDPAGKAVYPEPKSSVPYTVRVSIKDLNIRKGPGTNYGKTGYYTGKGVFTIVAESAGAGSAKGWGKLKSGAGWIALDFAARI